MIQALTSLYVQVCSHTTDDVGIGVDPFGSFSLFLSNDNPVRKSCYQSIYSQLAATIASEDSKRLERLI